MRLTERGLAQLPIKKAIYLVRDDKEPSLVVQVFPKGRKVYQVRTRTDNKVKTRTLGNINTVTLKEARLMAKKQVNEWSKAKGDISQSPTLATFMQGEWKEQVFSRWKPRTQRTVTLYMTKWLLPSWGLCTG